jgi:hypothetical protein
MIFAWSEYKCPHCGERFGDIDIATLHYTKKCPYCCGMMKLNSYQALKNGGVAGFLAMITGGIFIIFSINFLDELRPMLISVSRISEYLGIAMFIGYIGLGAFIAWVITAIYAKLMILFARKTFKSYN